MTAESSRPDALPSFEELYREAKLLREKKEWLAKKKKKEKEEKEMEEVTFKPQINSKGRTGKHALTMTSTTRINQEVELFNNNRDLRHFFIPDVDTPYKGPIANSYAYLS